VVVEGDREVTREEVVELADAVAVHGGIASGMGTPRYGAQLVVEADSRDGALARGQEVFATAARTAGLPQWPVVHADAVSEEEDDEGWDRPA
jgi:hypothetical protein